MNRFSHHARRALVHAGVLVNRYRHPRVDTAHLLVGVLLTNGSIGHRVLLSFDLDPDYAGVYLKSLTLPLDEALEAPANDAALDVCLELAADEAAWLGHHYIGTEHLLLGITRSNVGNAWDLLRLVGIQPDQIRRRVRSALDDGLGEFAVHDARRDAKLSELSRRVLNAAEQLAISRDHETIGLGHLLLMLAREKRSITSTLLEASHLDETLLDDLLNSKAVEAMTTIDVVLLQAGEIAQNFGNHFTGTEHLLLAIAIDPVGAAMMRSIKLSPEVIQRKVENRLRKSGQV